MIKVLISPGYGAGWSTWCDAGARFMATYEPIIQALEENPTLVLHNKHPLIMQLIEDMDRKFGTRPYIEDVCTLKVVSVMPGTIITEYDGYESVHYSLDDLGTLIE